MHRRRRNFRTSAKYICLSAESVSEQVNIKKEAEIIYLLDTVQGQWIQ